MNKISSTKIAYHWTQSCLDVETTEVRRAYNAIEWWEKAASEAIQKGAKIEALRLFQKAIDIWEKLNKDSRKLMAWSMSNHSCPNFTNFEVSLQINYIVLK